MTSTGTQISDMTDSLTVFPSGSFVPFIVTDVATGLNPTYNYRYDLGADLLTRVSYAALAASGGSADIGFILGGTGADATTVQDYLRRIVFAEGYGFSTSNTGAQNATALAEAIASLGSGGIVYIGPGTFTLNTTTIPSNITIQGAGMDSTIIVQGTITATGAAYAYGVLYAMSASYTTYVENLTFRGFTIKATAGTFSEFSYLIALSGVRNALVERVKFQGFQGDGLFLGGTAQNTAPAGASDYRHNINATVRDCVFDGVNNENRNGISVIDMDGMLIDNCRFLNCTKSTMPSAICFEPNAYALYVLRDCIVSNCYFTGIGGNAASVGIISVVVPSAVTAIPSGFRFLNNRMETNPLSRNDYFVTMGRTVAATDASSDIVIDGHHGKSGVAPFNFGSVRGVTVTNSHWDTYTTLATIGYDTTASLARNIVIDDKTTFTLCGSDTSQYGLLVGYVDYLTIGATIDRCGYANASFAPILFFTGATSLHVTFTKAFNVIGATSQTAAIQVPGGHTLTPAGNFFNGQLGGLTSAFVAYGPGQVLPLASLTWDPGSLADGAGETSSAVTVTGAAFGDTVQVAAPYDLVGCTLTGYVSAANAVKMRLQNESTATFDGASGSYKITVTKAVV